MLSATLVPCSVPEPLRALPLRVWAVPIPVDREPAADVMGALTDAERAHLRRFRHRADRARFAVVRSRLRTLLGERLGLPAPDVPLCTGAAGKPELAGDTRPCVFNVSHSGTLGVIGIADAGATGCAAVGVDVEQCLPMDPAALAAAAFPPAEQAMLAHGEAHDEARADRFYALWTAREAFAKAVGTGIADPQWQRLRFAPGASGQWQVHAPGGAAARTRVWSIRAPDLPGIAHPPYRLALAVTAAAAAFPEISDSESPRLP